MKSIFSEFCIYRIYWGAFLLFSFAVLFCPETLANERENEVHETVKIWLLHNLRKELGLNAEESLKLLDQLEKVETAKKEFHLLEREILQKVDRQLGQERDLPPEMTILVEKLEKKKEAILLLELETDREIKKSLNVSQRAQLMIILRRLHNKIRNIIDTLEKRSRRMEKRRNRPDGPPPDKPFHREQEPF